ncbi:site-specific integrase, partial [Escherichia coli]|nr:site-specific integrase [Escherichia coli]
VETFSEAINQFLEHLRFERNLSRHTLRNYAVDLWQFSDFLFRIEKRRDLTPAEIDNLTIREWMADMRAAGKRKTSIARKLASLRTFYQ